MLFLCTQFHLVVGLAVTWRLPPEPSQSPREITVWMLHEVFPSLTLQSPLDSTMTSLIGVCMPMPTCAPNAVTDLITDL